MPISSFQGEPMTATIKRWIRPAAFVLLLGLGFATRAFAQDASPTSVNDQTAAGDRPFASFMSADIDQVQLNNGALDVRIPLLYRKGRGLDGEQYWFYTNKTWMVQTVINIPGHPTYFWRKIKQQELTYVIQGATCPDGTGENITSNFIWTDRHGT